MTTSQPPPHGRAPVSMTGSLGRPVIATTGAATLGTVKSVVLDTTGRHVDALHVAGRARHAELLAWADVEGFGPDAVIARPGAKLRSVLDDQQEEMVRGRIEALGGRVLGTDGFARGEVRDIAFDPTTGEITSLSIGGIDVPAASIRGLGHHCWVVDETVPFA